MGNENKIGKQPQESGKELTTSTFLPEEIANPEGKPQIYKIEDEFPKTGKNRSVFLYIAVILFLGALVGGTILLTAYVRHQNRVTAVNISDFEDINLSQLLDQSKKDEADLQNSQKELARLRAELSRRLGQARSASERDRIQAEYQKKIASKEQEIKTLEKKVQDYNARLKSAEKKAESIVDNYQRLYQYKLNQQKNEYERKMRELVARYNPKFTETRVRQAIRSGLNDLVEISLHKYESSLARYSLAAAGDFDLLHKQIKDQQILLTRMQKVPYINSVPDTLKSIDYFSRAIIKFYDDLWYQMNKIILAKELELSQYKYALRYFLREGAQSGIILDPRNKNRIRVFMSPRYAIKTGDSAFVFRRDDAFIGRISFYYTGIQLFAKVESLEGSNQLAPFDKILLKMDK